MSKASPTTTADLSRAIDDEIDAFLRAERAFIEPEIHPLLDELEALIAAGGKRLRPRFCYWGYVAAGGTERGPVLRAGGALEVLHAFALIHDDVMDRSATRRHRHSAFHALAELSRSMSLGGDPARFGTSAALLTGLLGFVLADRMLQTCGLPPGVMPPVTERYDRMRTRAIAGQYLDLLASHRGEADEPTARRIAALKSGSYTVVDPLAMGALAAGAEPDVVQTLERYGRPLGEAFQMADDVLSVFGDPASTGKDNDGDLREAKQTVLLAKARALAGAAERKALDRIVGKADLTADDAARARTIIRACGALDATLEDIRRSAAHAVGALDRGRIDSAAFAALEALASEATTRTL